MKTIYQCDFCHLFTDNEKEMAIHELNCIYNPANRTCFTCEYNSDDGCLKGENTDKFISDCEMWREKKYFVI